MQQENLSSEGSEYKLKVYLDRYDKQYQDKINELLSYDFLISQSEITKNSGLFEKGYKRRVSIKFCGLSGLTLIGGFDVPLKNSMAAVESFMNIISNQNDTIQKLDDQGIYVDIKLLFAYPYSDFMYDLMSAERASQEGYSINCILNNKHYDHKFLTPKKLTYDDLRGSLTYLHLLGSLDKIQEAVNESRKYFNHVDSFNRLIVKFTPLQILPCFLKINHNIFFDPYLYSKDSPKKNFLGLHSPITSISIPKIPDDINALQEDERVIFNHYCSLISHFKYLWHHPLTLYSSDATEYDKGINRTLRIIREPRRISFLGKSLRLEKVHYKNENVEKSDVDLWRQYCKNELLRYCSKFVINKNYEFKRIEEGQINLNPVPLFIVGSWTEGDTNIYVNSLKEFISAKFNEVNTGGLKINPIVVDIEDATEIHKVIYENLNACQLGIVIQTVDYIESKSGNSKPNVYFEKGYLMGRLGRWQSKKDGKKKEMVFIFNEEKAHLESDAINIKNTAFSSLEDFEIQFFRIINWIWEVTELNSLYALSLLKQSQEAIEYKLKHETTESPTLKRHLRKVQEFIKEIKKWEQEYELRINNLRNA